MPRKKSETITVQIEGEDVEIKVIRGAKNAAVVFELMSLASRIIYAAGQAKIDLLKLFTAEDEDETGFGFLAKITGENFLVFDFVANELLKRWEHLIVKVFPVLLGKDLEWMTEHGTPFEYFNALWAALQLNAPNIFGEKNWASVKNLLSAAQEEPDESEQETQPEEAATS